MGGLRSWLSSLAVVVAVFVSGAPVAQSPCTLPPLHVPVPERPLPLTEAQEADLGDAMAEHLQQELDVVDDDTSDYLRGIGERILAQLPATSLRFRFLLLDGPGVNGLALPGGRVYITRKLVAFARSEDEVAGVVAHEIGHLVTREIASDMARLFRERLDVTSFGDRADVFAKYKRLLEHLRSAERNDRREEHGQLQADRVGLLAMARAGYSASAYAELWDRYTEAGGRTGNTFTALFGLIPPESRRLRSMVKTMEALPPSCRIPTPAGRTERFAAWQKRVVAGPSERRAGPIPGLQLERRLDPPLRDSLTHLRFSPDGRYVLAQDDATVYVLTREPFEVSFRVDADDAQAAHFTPDSRSLVFHTAGLRVERWDVASRARSAVSELVVRQGCQATALSPDGALLACILFPDELVVGNVMGRHTVAVIDVAAGDRVLAIEKPFRVPLTALWYFRLWAPGTFQAPWFRLVFSPDGRYLVAANESADLVIDLQARAEAELPGSMRRAFRRSFAFVGSDRVASVDPERGERSVVQRFPSGELLQTVTLGGLVSGVTRGDFVLLRPIRDWALGLVDLASGKLVYGSASKAFDVHDGWHVAERLNGAVGLYPVAGTAAAATAQLAGAMLGPLATAYVSPDLEWVALSGRERGGVWNVPRGESAVLVRGFSGAYLSGDGKLYADFPEFRRVVDQKPIEQPRAIVRVDLATKQVADHGRVEQDDAFQRSRFLAAFAAGKDKSMRSDVTLTVRDVRDPGVVLWTRHFPEEAPRWFFDAVEARLVLEWPLDATAARQALEGEPLLRERVRSQKLKGSDSYLELLDAATGTLLGRLFVPTRKGRVRIEHVVSSGDAAIVGDTENQVSVYSISGGTLLGAVFGRLARASKAAGLLCLENETGRLEIFDLASVQRLAEIRLPSRVRVLRFSDDGRRLLVLTADQVVRVIDTAALRAPTTASP